MKAIYRLLDPRTMATRYIGSTVSPSKRLGAHVSAATGRERSRAKARWVRGLCARNLRPLLEVIETVSDGSAVDRERYWIEVSTAAGDRLFNERAPGRSAPTVGARKIVCASLPVDDYARLEAFGQREAERSGLVPKDGTLACMLIRKGLDAVEAEVRA